MYLRSTLKMEARNRQGCHIYSQGSIQIESSHDTEKPSDDNKPATKINY